MKMVHALLALALLPVAVATAVAEPVHIPRPPAAPLAALLDRPAGAVVGGVVIAPGRGYSMNGPLLVECARALVAEGFLVLRFDWGFFSAGADPSVDGARELDDLRAAIGTTRERLRGAPLLLAGKSMGAALLLQLTGGGTRMDGLAGLALLTPPCHGARRAELAPELGRLRSFAGPLFVALGDDDPLCDPELLRKLPLPTQTELLVIADADHGLEDREGDPARTRANVAAVGEGLARWARSHVPTEPGGGR